MTDCNGCGCCGTFLVHTLLNLEIQCVPYLSACVILSLLLTISQRVAHLLEPSTASQQQSRRMCISKTSLGCISLSQVSTHMTLLVHQHPPLQLARALLRLRRLQLNRWLTPREAVLLRWALEVHLPLRKACLSTAPLPTATNTWAIAPTPTPRSRRLAMSLAPSPARARGG